MLGLGETVEEVLAVMRDLREVDVDILTLGQYLRPSKDHLPMDRYYTPDEFSALRTEGLAMGLSSRRVGAAREVQLSRLGTSPGGRRRLTAPSLPVCPSTRLPRIADRGSDKTRKRPDEATQADDTTPEQRHELLRSMLLQRRFEERCAEAYALGRIGGFCHLYIGQEAVGAGAIASLREDDYIVTTYRDHGQALARGMSPRAIMAELFGRSDGVARGKGGSMHLFDRALNFLGGHGIVGGHVPLAAGVGFAIKYRGTDQVCLCFMGESVVNTGAFHEALNMASLWKLPGRVPDREQPVRDGHGSGTGVIDQRHLHARRVVRHAARVRRWPGRARGAHSTLEAVKRARTESMPTLLEVRTYRFMGHSMSDAVSGTYRTKAELEEYMKRDPIMVLRMQMQEAGEIDDAGMTKLDEELKAVVQDAWDFAEKSPEPPLESLYENVLVETTT
jgi:pyruvate dehydrogenase E1 component alpha subunit